MSCPRLLGTVWFCGQAAAPGHGFRTPGGSNGCLMGEMRARPPTKDALTADHGKFGSHDLTLVPVTSDI